MSLGGRPCALGKKRVLVPAIPMSWHDRVGHYCQTNNSPYLTPRQWRRTEKKANHMARRNGSP